MPMEMKQIRTRGWVMALLLFSALVGQAQDLGIIRGKVFDAQTNEPIPFANVVLQGATTGTQSDLDGAFELTRVPA